MNDPIVEEIRKYREAYAARFNYELARHIRLYGASVRGLKQPSRPEKTN